tara:strand:- start:2088 stop:3155 length:1068 start_codon:yes stop_codon:yes gene_type:complete
MFPKQKFLLFLHLMNSFNNLKILSVEKNTEDSVILSFKIPENLKKPFSFKAGQYITLEKKINDKIIRRPYSICSSPDENTLKVGIKKVKGGVFSTYANRNLKAGDFIKVSNPEGKFIYKNIDNSIIAIAAGSGITPIISIIKTILNKKTLNKIHLLYVNKSPEKTMFYELLKSLEFENKKRFKITWFFTEAKIKNSENRRINESDITKVISNQFLDNLYYLCGPGKMNDFLKNIIIDNKVNPQKIFCELFENTVSEKIPSSTQEGQLEIIYDNYSNKINFKSSEILLDSILNNNIDVPYSCQGGVCSSCIARIKKGTIEMKTNQILTDEEINEGLILTCQSIPKSSSIIIDFDDV